MTLYNSPNSVLSKVAGSLVAEKRFATVEEALWDMAVSTVRGKVAYYRRKIRKMENKYGMEFDKFTTRLKGTATPALEDDWLAWKSAISMLADWQKTYQDLLHASHR
ncbi:MAG: hypothetical protein WA821_09140 [Anaerolineales bacterium]